MGIQQPARASSSLYTCAVLACLIQAAPPRLAHAIEIDDGAGVLGLAAGLSVPQGGSASAVGQGTLLGGQFLYHPQGEWAVGLQVDHLNQKVKLGRRTNFTSVFLSGRANIELKSDLNLPYLLLGLGYAAGHADLGAGATDGGAGLGFRIGGGVDRFVTKRLSAGLEAHLDRLAAPLRAAGLGGVTLAELEIRLNWWLGPAANPFP